MEGTTSTPTTSAAPVSAPSATPSGVTTSTATPTPAERPKTFAEAFANDAASQTPPSTEMGTATTQPVEGTDPQSATPPSTDAKGPIPFEVHQKSLENARTKAVTEFRQTAGIDKAVDFATKITANPAAFLREYTSELLAHPQHGPAARAELARMFGGLRQTVAPAAEPMPQPDVQIVDANNAVTGTTYSAEQLAKRDAWREKQLLAKVQQEYGPLKTERDQRAAHEKAVETAKQAAAKADQHLARVDRILDGDKALYVEVNRLMAADPSLDAVDAALEVRKQKIAPAAESKAQADVLKSLQTKAAAQAVNPAGAAVAATSRPKSFMDKSLKW